MLKTVTIFLNRFDTFLQTQVTVLKTDKWSEHFVMVLNRLYILIHFTQTVIFLINSLMFSWKPRDCFAGLFDEYKVQNKKNIWNIIGSKHYKCFYGLFWTSVSLLNIENKNNLLPPNFWTVYFKIKNPWLKYSLR